MIRPSVLKAVFSAVISVTAATVLAYQHPDHDELPDIDKRRPANVPAAAVVAKGELAANLGKRIRGLKVNVDRVTGVPRWIGSSEDFLTGPQGTGKGVSAASAARFRGNDPHRPVKAFVHEHAALFGHGVEALDRAQVERDFVTAHNGMRTVVWRQTLDGIPLYNARFVGHITKRGELINVASLFVPDLDGAVARSFSDRAVLLGAPPVSAEHAIAIAGRNVGEAADHTKLISKSKSNGPERRQKFTGGNLIGESSASLTYFPLAADTLRLAWETIVTRRTGGEMYLVVVDAENGDVLLRRGLTTYLTDATYNVFTSDSPSPFSPGHPTPMSTQPPVVPRTLVTLSALNLTASPNGWIDDDVNETRGNNVDAHLDRNNDNSPDLPRVQGAPFRVFDFPLDLTQSPTSVNSQNAAVVQLFYWNNFMHDALYDLGFTEAAGNFQNDNFDRGGAGEDAVQADAQDGGGFNNANFSTPPDGSVPRMQMYLFNQSLPFRDGSLDAEVVLHEYTHGLSNRRVGNGAGISALQSRGMGEGWADFYALALLSEPGDALDGNTAMGGYVTYQYAGMTQNYYYGIRRYPYSTNLSKNPLTFKDIDPLKASTHLGIPRSPVIGGQANEVHNMGEVWCVTLWDARANLIRKYGYAVGNQLILQLVTDGMALSPNDPTFLEARDGILQADLVSSGGVNFPELWAAFARRGMGFSAICPVSSSTVGVMEAFDNPDDLRITPSEGLTSSGSHGGPFNPGTKTYLLTNTGMSSVTWTATTTTNWLTLTTNGGVIPAGGSVTSLVAQLNVNTAMLPRGVYTNNVLFSNLTSGRVQTRAFVLSIDPVDSFTELFDALDNDLHNQQLVFTPDGSDAFYRVCRRNVSGFPTDPTGGTEVALGDDTYVQVTLGNNKAVPFYGTSRNYFFIGSNGYITFGSGDTEFSPSLASHFNRARIAGLFVDLLPPSGGSISWKQLGDRVVVTWEGIAEFGTTHLNSFQIEMYFTGVITITHLNLDSQRGLVGLSPGTGVPSPFIESDLSAYATCFPPFTIEVPPVVTEGEILSANAGAVYLESPLTNDVSILLGSSDTNSVSVPASVFIPAGQTYAPFDVTVLDDILVNGPRAVLIMGTAPGFSSANATMTVNDNEPVVLTLEVPVSVWENAGILVTQGVVRASLPTAVNVSVALASSVPSKLQVPASVTIPAGQTSAVFNLTAIDNTIMEGTVDVQLTAVVNNWIQANAELSVLDDETDYGQLDHFALSTVAGPKAAGAPFPLTISARDATNQLVLGFSGTLSVRGLRPVSSNDPVRLLVFTGSSDTYSNELNAIPSHFTNFVAAKTVTTDPADLRSELAVADVFLIPAQPQAQPGTADALGTLWSGVLKEFVSRGGIFITCSPSGEEYQTPVSAGLIQMTPAVQFADDYVTNVVGHPLTAGVDPSFNSSYFTAFDSASATPVTLHADDSLMVVAVNDYGLGHTIVIGAEFTPDMAGTEQANGLPRLLANAVTWSKASRFTDVAITPGPEFGFSLGQWSGLITITKSAPNMFLMASDEAGHFGFGNAFTVIGSHAPVASNVLFALGTDSVTDLPLAGFDADGDPLTYSIVQLPTNGLLSTLVSPTNFFGYSAAHGFAGTDSFAYVVTDGISTSAPATVNLTVSAMQDSDGDGIPDWWEDAHGLNKFVNDANADPDGDGLTNLQEYLANTNPQDRTSGVLWPQVQMINGQVHLTWRAVGGVRYRVSYSDGGTNGLAAANFIEVVRPAALEMNPAAVGASATMTFVDDFVATGGSPANGRRFYRVKLVR